MTRINTNVSSLIGRNNLNRANAGLSQALTRLSTGLRINTGKDDPAGLIASENLRSDITSIKRAISNTDRANQVIATADSALGQVSSLLNDIRGLVTESANAGALSDEQVAANQLQVDSSLEALNRIAQTTTFQGRRLLDGTLDFITDSADSDFSNISDLKIDQANLGSAGSVDVDIAITTAATQATVEVADFPAATTAAQATGDLDLTLNQSAVAGSVTGGGSFVVDTPAEQATGTTAALTNGDALTITALAGGAADGTNGNDIDITFVDSNDSGGAVNGVNFAAGVITVTADLTTGVGSDVIAAAIAASNGGADFSATSDGTANVVAADVGTLTDVTTGGVDAATDAPAAFTATTTAGENFDITFDLTGGSGTGIAVTGDATLGYTVTIGDDYVGDLNSVAAAINSNVGEISDAAFDTNLTLDVAEGDNGSTIANVVNITGGSATGAVGTLALDIATVGNTDAYNDFTIDVTEGGGTGNEVIVSLDTGTGSLGVDITGTVTAQEILDAINAFEVDGAQVFEATFDSTNSTGGFTAAGTSYVESSDSAPGTAPTLTGGDTGGGLANDVVFELSGTNGAEVISFGAGTSIDSVVDGINLVSDATGVTATANGTTLEFTTSAYGTDAFVDLSVIEDDGGLFSDTRTTGTDVVATVNGISATGSGNVLSINTASLDLTATVDSSFTGTASFTISGGGALFQLGPDVVSNQQARLGIGSVNTARLGGASGKLYQLGTGGSADLSTDTTVAADIIGEAIDQVTSLRGRLGAFQRTTLETNKNALNDTLNNLTEAESSIRDADFAEETANLTRSQILVQSGTRVLQISNQNPQNVLSLLG